VLDFVGAAINKYWLMSFYCPLSYGAMSSALIYSSTSVLSTLNHGFPPTWQHDSTLSKLLNSTMAPYFVEGVYMTIFDLVHELEGICGLKTCSLVCKEWHLLLRPSLFATLTLDVTYVHAHENDKRVLEYIYQFARKAIICNWTRLDLKTPRMVLSLSAALTHTTSLEFSCVFFLRSKDLVDCLSNMTATLKFLSITHCRLMNEDDSTLDNLVSPYHIGKRHHHLGLHHLRYEAIADDSLAAIMMSYLAGTPTLQTIRILSLALMGQDDMPLFSLVGDPSCNLEELIGDLPHHDCESFMPSVGLSKQSFDDCIGEILSSNSLKLLAMNFADLGSNILVNSMLPALATIQVYLTRNENKDWDLSTDDKLFTSTMLRRRFPTLRIVQLIACEKEVDQEDIDYLWLWIHESSFLIAANNMQLLTVVPGDYIDGCWHAATNLYEGRRSRPNERWV
jgi:hypothetical protein